MTEKTIVILPDLRALWQRIIAWWTAPATKCDETSAKCRYCEPVNGVYPCEVCREQGGDK